MEKALMEKIFRIVKFPKTGLLEIGLSSYCQNWIAMKQRAFELQSLHCYLSRQKSAPTPFPTTSRSQLSFSQKF